MSTEISIAGTSLGSPLMDILETDEIVPGTQPSYQLCKLLYTTHVLGGKMAEAPITMAQSQPRTIAIQNAPAEVLQEFLAEQKRLTVNEYVHNVMSLSRVYGIASIALICEGKSADKPVDMESLWKEKISFNTLDPLNTAGSLVLSQIPGTAEFQKPTHLTVDGKRYHMSRFEVVMNEAPVYIDYTGSAFGFVGRSVYQRALFPMRSFINTMVADDVIATKNALLVAKHEQPGSIIDNMMEKVFGIRRALLKWARSGQVFSIGKEESIETLDMTNVDTSGTYSRGNILKNIATAADMPAKLLENETMVSGFGEGTEDAKSAARYIESIREKMARIYAWFDNITMHRAWSPDFYKRIQAKYPGQYGNVEYFDAFSAWRQEFTAVWPSFLIEPESEQQKQDKTKLDSIMDVVEKFLPHMDPENKVRVLEWAADNISENKRMFAHGLVLDFDSLREFVKKQQAQADKQQQSLLDNPGGVDNEDDDADDGQQPFAKAA